MHGIVHVEMDGKSTNDLKLMRRDVIAKLNNISSG